MGIDEQPARDARSQWVAQGNTDRRLPRGEACGHEVSIELTARVREQRRSTLSQPKHDHVHPWCRHKVLTPEAMDDSRIEPRQDQKGCESSSRKTCVSTRGFYLNGQEHV